MTIILPKDYHAQQLLESNGVICIPEEQALREDIRALRIGILNIMPEAKFYEFNLLHPLGKNVIQIIPVWIRLESHKYGSTNPYHLDRLYQTYDKVVKQEKLDGMIITGAPVEKLQFHEVRYWDEISEIIKKCRLEVNSTLGICWGGLALAYLLGIEKITFDKKLFGIFETYNLDRNHEITGGLDDVFWLPQSRYAGINDHYIEECAQSNIVNLLAHSTEAGYSIFESNDKKCIINLGHFEYNASRIVYEYKRDIENSDSIHPTNFDVEKPLNKWRGQRNEFFSQWIKFCHQKNQEKK